MIQEENVFERLTELLKLGQMPRSACSSSLRRTLGPLLDSGVVAEERAGGGRRLVVHNFEALHKFTCAQFPNASISAALGTRTAGVARFRDSKAFPSDTPEIVSVRAWAEDALLKDGKPLRVAAATLEHGVFSFLLGERTTYSLRGPCAFVENPTVFVHFERLKLPVGLAIWSSRGRASNRVIEWLAGNAEPSFTLLHLPDYDPVGMLEFKRLKESLGARVHLHLPPDLAERFSRFGNRKILQKRNNQAMLATARRVKLAEVRAVVDLIDRNNACLEHEALLF